MIDKLFIISKMGEKPFYLRGLYNRSDHDFYISHLQEVKPNRSILKPAKALNDAIDELLKSQTEAGYICYIEEKTNIHGHLATPLNLDDRHAIENRTLRDVAVETYFQVLSNEAFKWDNALNLNTKIIKRKGTNINIIEDDSGRKRYKFEKEFSSEMRCILLMMIASDSMPLASNEYAEKLMALAGFDEEPKDGYAAQALAFIKARERSLEV